MKAFALIGVPAVLVLLGALPAAAAAMDTEIKAEEPLDLATTLRLAGGQNPDVMLARERLIEAQARFRQTRMRFLPWIEPGIGYRRHEGSIQDVDGDVRDVSKQSHAVGAMVGMELDLGDAHYASLAAKQKEREAAAAADVSAQDALHAAVKGYYRLASVQGAEVVERDGVRIADEYAVQVRSAVEAGLAFRGDLFRAEMQAEQNRTMLRRTMEQAVVGSAGLARILRLPPDTRLRARSEELVPLSLVETNGRLSEWVAVALAERPELSRIAAARAAAVEEYRGDRYGPWIPALSAQALLGGMGGGPDGEWGSLENTGDYAVGLRWRIGSGGMLDRAAVRASESRVRALGIQADSSRDDVVAQVVVAFEGAQSLASQLVSMQRAIAAAEELVRCTRERREFGVGVVLEAVQAEQELTRLRVDYMATIAAYNVAQFSLKRATGRLR